MIRLPIRQRVGKIGNARDHIWRWQCPKGRLVSVEGGLNGFALCSLAVGLVGDGASSAFERLVVFVPLCESSRATLAGVTSKTSVRFQGHKMSLFMGTLLQGSTRYVQLLRHKRAREQRQKNINSVSVSASTTRERTLHFELSVFLIWTATFPPIQLTVFIYLNW